ncbi:helix-turn-helix domain-containing protein [Streptomyces sp. NEAU-Y11]|uniref:helix-turn-helix domain-containing protein n=1 Tax=Streptomyces cucumeris TaxID=2962890 RepID=UPI0020C878A2|nr:helix-turn-helix transcriptional regulator [Streptomyces sp. NEAU-Y11]MCP9205477.1 helix-turn-helix domain-containing protein [Streptomyces sp. NEAU-Y11]
MHVPTDPPPDWILRWRRDIGTRVRDLRMDRNLTQEGLAGRIGAERRTIYRIEQGMHSPSLDRLLQIARALHVAPSALMPDSPLDPTGPREA